MKKNFFLAVLSLTALFIGLVNSCRKTRDYIAPGSVECPSDNGTPTDVGIKASFTEEFDSVGSIQAKGWITRDNTPAGNTGLYAGWTQGPFGVDKGSVWHGFAAWSYTSSETEYVFSYLHPTTSTPVTVSSWLITPVLSVKNGDKISFYTRSDTIGANAERIQVLMNKSSSGSVGSLASSVCGFTTVLMEINSAQAPGGYPTTWTKYEYTFYGITGRIDTRVAFRHYVTNTSSAKGIGIDLFKFEVN